MHPDFTAFLDHLAVTAKSPLTVRRYGDVLRDLEQFTSSAEPASLTSEMLRRFAATSRKDGRPRLPAGVNLRIAVMRATFTFLTAERAYTSNPALRVVATNEKRRTPKYLAPGDVRRLVEHVAREREPLRLRNVALVVFFWQTALRVAEVARLRIDQLDYEARLLRSVRVKGGHELDVALNDETLAVLDQYLATRGELTDDAPLFATREGTRLSVRAIQARFESWRSELGWTRPLHPHVLRHTHATQALAAGIDIATVADLLRHADLRTVLVYAKVQDTARRAALVKLGALVPPSILPSPTLASPAEPASGSSPTAALGTTVFAALAAVPPANDVALTDFPCVEGGFYAA